MLLYLVCSEETAWRNSLQGTDQKLLMASGQRNAKQLGHTGQRLPRSVAHKFASPGATTTRQPRPVFVAILLVAAGGHNQSWRRKIYETRPQFRAYTILGRV